MNIYGLCSGSTIQPPNLTLLTPPILYHTEKTSIFKNLVLKSERRTKATRSKNEAGSAKRKSVGLFVPEAQEGYINFYIYPTGF
ncbi:hypothetical protein HanPSC8_Chr17g0748341 [Helianthus annuus]|nr:hypothetical protein HanPSC8_Chr17g0748341 [Helianthus annuus]